MTFILLNSKMTFFRESFFMSQFIAFYFNIGYNIFKCLN